MFLASMLKTGDSGECGIILYDISNFIVVGIFCLALATRMKTIEFDETVIYNNNESFVWIARFTLDLR